MSIETPRLSAREQCVTSLLLLEGDSDHETAHLVAERALLFFLSSIGEHSIVSAYQHVKSRVGFQYA
jgi:hypothetical protein